VFEGDGTLPVRESRFDPKAREVKLDREALIAEYNGKVLPQAIEANRQLILAMKKFASVPAAAAYEAEAERAEMAERRRYCLDIARELYFLETRKTLRARGAALPYPTAAADRAKGRSMQAGSKTTGYSMGDSMKYWEIERRVARFEEHYANGRFAEARKTLEEIQ
jgi:hypothetical protein